MQLFRQSALDNGCLSADEVSALFSNLDEVIAVNSKRRRLVAEGIQLPTPPSLAFSHRLFIAVGTWQRSA